MGLLAMTVLNYAGTRQITNALEELVPQEPTPTVYATTWTSAGPLTHTVTTPRAAGEPAVEHAARHAADVAALQTEFPPV